MKNPQNIDEILSVLRCVECGKPDLITTEDDAEKWKDYIFQPGGRALVCNNCGTHYPITDDGIPIMWTSQIRKILRSKGGEYSKLGSSDDYDALSSNIIGYDRISNDYAVNCRRDNAIAKRIQAGSIRLKKTPIEALNGNGFHLDIGCGPGHVLEWLADSGYRQIGLDVSLTNLRNARKATGAHVVLGDGTEMPFRDDTFSLVTESAVLHHIFDWRKAILEACRVCSKTNGGVLFDSEPTFESLSLSFLAKFVFEMRWPAYKILSYCDSKKIHFRHMALAKEYYETAETHNQPGRGFSVEEVDCVFRKADFTTEFFLSPNEHFQKRQTITWNEAGWKRIVLHLLSGHNPLLAKNGLFTVLAVPHTGKKVHLGNITFNAIF